jgi:hypothetical protein
VVYGPPFLFFFSIQLRALASATSTVLGNIDHCFDLFVDANLTRPKSIKHRPNAALALGASYPLALETFATRVDLQFFQASHTVSDFGIIDGELL